MKYRKSTGKVPPGTFFGTTVLLPGTTVLGPSHDRDRGPRYPRGCTGTKPAFNPYEFKIVLYQLFSEPLETSVVYIAERFLEQTNQRVVVSGHSKTRVAN